MFYNLEKFELGPRSLKPRPPLVDRSNKPPCNYDTSKQTFLSLNYFKILYVNFSNVIQPIQFCN